MKTFQVLQGNNPGSAVGYVKERMGQTDIALAKLHDDGVTFENKFMKMEAAPRKLLASVDHNIGDHFIFDSFAVDRKQTVSYLGRRFTLGWRQGTAHPDVKYIALEQGAFVSNSPDTMKPQIRDSVCGSVLLRCWNSSRRTQKTMIEDGEIGGMLQSVDVEVDIDVERRNRIDSFIMYADSFDPLIEAGWTVAHGHQKN